MAGLPASGKSAIAQQLSYKLNAVLIDKDTIRVQLFQSAVDYEREQDDLCVNVMYDVARYHLKKRPGIPVILDGRSYSRRYQVDAVKKAAVKANSALFFIECQCSPESARARLIADQDNHPAKNRNYSMYEQSRAAAEVINEPKLVLNTDSHSESECLQLALMYLKNESLSL